MPPLNPLLETDKIECIHKGKVILQSSTKDLMCVQDSNGTDAGVISLNDLVNAVIIGCTNNIAGIPNPCTKLVSIPNSITSSLLEIDNQKIVLAQTISQVITDKGSPLILQEEPKAKDIFKIDEDIAESMNEISDNSNEFNADLGESSEDSSEILTPLPQRYASNDDMAIRDFVKWQEWEKFKKYYLNMHKINTNDRIESKNRIEQEEGRLDRWVKSKDNIFRYEEKDFIDAEIRYYRIKGAIYDLFMNSPYQRINTCTARLSKALYDYGISIKRLKGMESADLAYAGKNTNDDRILIKVKDMVTFLKESEHFGELETYSATNGANFYHTFYDESYDKLVLNKKILNQTRVDEIRQDNEKFHTNLNGKKGIIALEIEAWGDAFGHITLWENNDFVDESEFLPDKREYVFVKTLYFWEFS